jgi:hypothetical protein
LGYFFFVLLFLVFASSTQNRDEEGADPTVLFLLCMDTQRLYKTLKFETHKFKDYKYITQQATIR